MSRISDPGTWERAKDLIAEALKQPRGDQAAFVRARCADPAVCAEIEAMLDAYEEDPDFLENTAQAVDEADELADLRSGVRVGPYVVVERLGRGGMGQVFLATDPRLNRRVALKCLIASRAADDDRRSRILREARTAARITHPNVAAVYDVIEHDGRAFIVMEYVEGESLAARLRRDRPTIEQSVAIGRQLAAALAAAHATGVIHRDLKPANVQLTADGTAKVLDFGVAKTSAVGATTNAATTRAGGLALRAGTPGYMSPEQVLGRRIDDRSDIFGLGVVMFEMTTGGRPLDGADPLELVVKLARQKLRARLDRAAVPQALIDVIMKALEIDADDRYQTAADVEAALTAIEHGLAYRTGRDDVRPSKLRAAAIAAVVVAGVPFGLGLLGYLTLVALNDTFGRLPPFGTETPVEWVVWGFRSLLPTLFWASILTVAAGAIRFAVRLARLAGPVDRALTAVEKRGAAIATRVGLDDPVVLAQAIAALGFVALAMVCWRFWDLLVASTGSISTSPADRFLPLRSDDLSDAWWYRFSLDGIILFFGVSWARLVQIRSRRNLRHGAGGVALVAAVFVIALLMNELPYRIMWQNRFEKIDYVGTRCYLIGEHDNDLLVFCPDTAPPRNRVVKRDDPAVRRLGIVESVFTPAMRPRSAS